jgi:hypothetical protein
MSIVALLLVAPLQGIAQRQSETRGAQTPAGTIVDMLISLASIKKTKDRPRSVAAAGPPAGFSASTTTPYL